MAKAWLNLALGAVLALSACASIGGGGAQNWVGRSRVELVGAFGVAGQIADRADAGQDWLYNPCPKSLLAAQACIISLDANDHIIAVVSAHP